jgi:hypothetical protein
MESTNRKTCRTCMNRETPTRSASTAAVPLPRLLYSRVESAHQLSLSVRAIDYMVAQGAIRVRRIGGRILIPHSELLRLARTDQIEHITPPSSSSAASAAA